MIIFVKRYAFVDSGELNECALEKLLANVSLRRFASNGIAAYLENIGYMEDDAFSHSAGVIDCAHLCTHGNSYLG